MSYNLYIVYDDYVTGGEICPGMENDEWPSFEPQNHDFRLKSAHHRQNSSEKDLPWERSKFELDFNPKDKYLYIVLVRYGDGDTFSSSNGLGHIEAVCEYQGQAHKIAEQIKNKSYKSPNGYIVWDSYFGGLEDVSVISLLTIE